MLKTISAALLAVSMLAAPALAASDAKIVNAPAAKSATVVTPAKTNAVKVSDAKSKPGVLNANAKMVRHHRHVAHHRSHKRFGAHHMRHVSKLTIKHVAPHRHG